MPRESSRGSSIYWRLVRYCSPRLLKANRYESSDGGGVRGYWTILVLRHLMQKIGHLEEQDPYLSGEKEPHHVCSSFSPHAVAPNCCHAQGNGATGPGSDNSNEDLELSEIQERRRPKEQRYLPCHYFDYIGGSSTGAYVFLTQRLATSASALTPHRLIAIMLGRLRMPVADCLDMYKHLARRVFGDPNFFCEKHFPLPLVSKTKYNARGLEQVLEDVAAQRQPTNTNISSRFSLAPGVCKV